MEKCVIINGNDLTLNDYEKVAINHYRVKLDPTAWKRVNKNRIALETTVKTGKVIYGVNTGFGPMCNRIIPSEKINDLQFNLIRSHSSGNGAPLCREIVRGCMLLRANTLARGYSGVSVPVIDILIDFLNNDLYPLIPERGSVGASGDLVHLAHLALTLIGEGSIFSEDKWRPADYVLKKFGITPITPSYKEGLALINGTSMTSSIGCHALVNAKKLMHFSGTCTAMCLEVLEGTTEAFDPNFHAAKSHWGQNAVAKMIHDHLLDSNLTRKNASVLDQLKQDREKETLLTSKISIQDAYSLRCVPQIIGPVVETIRFVENILVAEMNSTSDNPVILDHQGTAEVCHGGHFHAQYCSMAFDYLSIALAELGVLAERQINRLTNTKLNGDLPPFLIPEGHGLRSGLMGLQYLATSTTAELQALSTPLSIHSISTNADNQDIVSMGPSSALRAVEQAERVFRIFAIQYIALVQGLEFRDVSEASSKTQHIFNFIRSHIPPITEDRPMYNDIQTLIDFMKNNAHKELVGIIKDSIPVTFYDCVVTSTDTTSTDLEELYEYAD